MFDDATAFMKHEVGWPDIGLPKTARFRRLLHSSTAQMMVVHAETSRDPFRTRRLYGKAVEATTYLDLVPAAAEESLEDPVVCPATPSLYYLSLVWEKQYGRYSILREGKEPEWREGDTSGAWLRGVFRKDLQRGDINAVVEYAIKQQHDVWVSSLHGVAQDGRTLVCSVAFASPGPERDAGYFLCELDVATGKLSKLAPLRAVFF